MVAAADWAAIVAGKSSWLGSDCVDVGEDASRPVVVPIVVLVCTTFAVRVSLTILFSSSDGTGELGGLVAGAAEPPRQGRQHRNTVPPRFCLCFFRLMNFCKKCDREDVEDDDDAEEGNEEMV